jgi:hypothetical protein
VSTVEHSQWHYILGYAITLTGHNWPVMLCLALGLRQARRLYRRANPVDVRLLYGWALLGLAYEYQKHLRGVFDEAVDFLLVWKAWEWNSWGHLAVGLALPLIMAAALWMFWAAWRLREGTARTGDRVQVTGREVPSS